MRKQRALNESAVLAFAQNLNKQKLTLESQEVSIRQAVNAQTKLLQQHARELGQYVDKQNDFDGLLLKQQNLEKFLD